MAYPKYFVTYCVMTPEAEANILGHASLLLCRVNSEEEPVEVFNSYGFYSQPSTTTWYSPLTYILKKLLSLTIDVQNTHGVLNLEEMRYLDRGIGLIGFPIEVSAEQLQNLDSLCQSEIALQTSVIKELNNLLRNEGKDANGANRYAREIDLAKEENRQPRLYPFHFKLELGQSSWLSTHGSYTCKSRAIDFLREIGISEAVLSQLSQSEISEGIPRLGITGKSKLLLYSEGKQQLYVKSRDKSRHFFKQWPKNDHDPEGAKLYFALPPKEMLGIDMLDDEMRSTLESVVSELLVAERALLHSTHSERFAEKKLTAVRGLRLSYSAFSTIATYEDKTKLIEKLEQAREALLISSDLLYADSLPAYFVLQCYQLLSETCIILGLLAIVGSVTLLNGVTMVATVGASSLMVGSGIQALKYANLGLDILKDELSEGEANLEFDPLTLNDMGVVSSW